MDKSHRRTGEDDAADLLIAEGTHCHCDCKVGLSGTGRSDAEGDGVVLDRIGVFFLPQRFGLDRFAFDRHSDTAVVHLHHALLAALFHQCDYIADILFRQGPVLCNHRQQGVHRALRFGNCFAFAGDFHLGAAADKMHAKMFLNNFCVLVRISKQDQNLFYFFNLQYLFDEFSPQKYIKITIFQFSLVIIPHQIIFLNTLSKFKCNLCHFAQNFALIFSHPFLPSSSEVGRDEGVRYPFCKYLCFSTVYYITNSLGLSFVQLYYLFSLIFSHILPLSLNRKSHSAMNKIV